MLLVAVLGLLLSGAAAANTADPALLEQALLHHVRDGYVDYDGMAASPQFETFIARLATTSIPGDRQQALALYINAYNAFAIASVLQGHAPVSATSQRRFFHSIRHELGGVRMTLQDIEAAVAALDEPRAWFALSCAALSCPRLANEAYRAETLDAQLDAATAVFINDITRNRIDIAQQIAFLSPLIQTHRDIFEEKAGSLPQWLASHVADPAARAALREGWLELQFLDHEWELNGSQPTRRRTTGSGF